MQKRMSLVEGLKRDEEQLDPTVVENFVKHGSVVAKPDRIDNDRPSHRTSPESENQSKTVPQTAAMTPGLMTVSVRVRPEIAIALQTATLQRKFQGIEPFIKREIVEQALEPWLKDNGFL